MGVRTLRVGWVFLAVVFLLVGCSATGSRAAAAGHEPTGPGHESTAASARGVPGGGLLAVPIPIPPRVTGHYPTSCHTRTENGKILPDPKCTPGSFNPAVTPSNLRQTICVPGWTKTVRPPDSNTEPVKTEAMRAYGQDPSARSTTELDHLVPLELGGSDDVTNLWPEPTDLPGHGVNNTKDTVEHALNKAVCSGKVDLNAARAAIATDWTTAEQKLGLR